MTDLVVTLAAALLNCVTTEVALISVPPQHVRYAVGSEIPYDIAIGQDLCCEGLAYVSLDATYFSTDTFPEIDQINQRRGTCAPAAWGQKFRVGIIRCVPTGQIDAIITDAEWNTAAALNMEDAYAMRRIACCFRTWVDSQIGDLLGMSLYVDQQTQLQPQGGCVERNMEIAVQLPNKECGCLDI